MAKTNVSTLVREVEENLEHTNRRIAAYLATVRPLVGASPLEEWHRGRAIIERMATNSHGYDDPRIALTLDQCADVLGFIEGSEPCDPQVFFASDANPSPQVGLMLVLRVVSARLRRSARMTRRPAH